MKNMFFAGIDLGSTMTKTAIIDQDGTICSEVVRHTGAEHRRLANKVMEEALSKANLKFEQITYLVATGYGRISVPFADRQITELNCHAKGISFFYPNVRLAIDIGGQDAKGLKIRDGKLVDFVMSDKCAAGTGRFLEIMAKTMELGLDELGDMSLKSREKTTISRTCTVFARQEVITRLSEGVPPADILAGVHDAIAVRTTRMIGRFDIEPDVLFTGGVAKNKGVVKAIQEHLGLTVLVPENPLLSGAIGAALLAKEIAQKTISDGKPLQPRERLLDEATFYN
jgi:(R)-2-hydroxyacyl-CoA dehydratese activating ATPase